MAKGYWIGRVEVNNDEGYKPYARGEPGDLQEVRRASSWFAAASTNASKAQSRSRNVVIEFPDYATAVACYRSPEYQANLKIRQANAITDLIIVEGYDGPQP